MANQSGVNQFNRFAPPKKHGEVKQLQDAQKAAPMSGAPVSALNAPRRHQRHATGQDRPREAAGPAMRELQQMELPELPAGPSPDQEYAEFLAGVWEKAAALPGASRLVKQYAKEAREAVGRNL